jgi:hypothetical protein
MHRASTLSKPDAEFLARRISFLAPIAKSGARSEVVYVRFGARTAKDGTE